jgi:hypothetical protein
LEKYVQDSELVINEVLLDIVENNVLIAGPDDHDDNSKSIGTINELPFLRLVMITAFPIFYSVKEVIPWF